MERYFTLLDADLSKFTLGSWWGDGRYEHEIPVEGVYLYRPIGNEFILAAVRKQHPDLFSEAKYDLYEVRNGDGKHCNMVDFAVGNAYKASALKRTNVHLTFQQINDLDLFSSILNEPRSEIIREAINEKIAKLKNQALKRVVYIIYRLRQLGIIKTRT